MNTFIRPIKAVRQTERQSTCRPLYTVRRHSMTHTVSKTNK